MGADLVARGLVAAESARARRLRTLHALRTSLARTGMAAPKLAATVPTFGTPSSTTTIASGTLYTPMANTALFTFAGGAWAVAGTTYPNNAVFKPIMNTMGNGTDPTANPTMAHGGRVRFTSWAPVLELNLMFGGTGGGFRLKVDGEYVHTGLKGHSADGSGIGNGSIRYIPVTWGDGSATYRKLRHYELEFGSSCLFGGVRVGSLYTVGPWAQPDGLRVLFHGDSMVTTVTDSTDHATQLQPNTVPHLANLLGQADVWNSGVGSSGYAEKNANTRSNFLERVAIDVVARAPDVIVEIGGKNDQGDLTQAALQALVETWITTVLAAKPETVIFMTGPIASNATEAGSANCIAVRDAKRDAAAKFPRNAAFIDNLAEGWVTGTGRVGATASNGNADWITGTDATHPSVEGGWYLASRLVQGIARTLPGLIAAQ